MLSRRATEPAGLSGCLRQAWLRQIQREYDAICFQYRIDLPAPLILLSDSRTRLGYWNASTRELALSSHLVRHQSWAVTCQVLKHEMAHQICSDIFKTVHAGHGPAFVRAASLIGTEPRFRHASIDCAGLAGLRSRPGRNEDSTAHILARVEKLFALAGSDNENEAALAMERAWHLLRKYNLQLAEQRPDYRRVVIPTGRKRMPAHIKQICALLQDRFFVRVIVSTTYLPAQDREVKAIEIFGRPANVDVAAHCYHFLAERTEQLWQENRSCFGAAGRQARTGYLCGLITGFAERLEDAARSCAVQEDGLSSMPVRVPAERALLDFVASYYPRLVRSPGRAKGLHGQAYEMARGHGRAIVLHRVIRECGHSRKLLG